MHRLLELGALALLLTLGSLMLAGPVLAAPEDTPPARPGAVDETQTQRPSLPEGELQIKTHDVSVVINNGFATTTVDQTLVNLSGHAVEAAWAFPLPREAALSELSLEAAGVRYMGEVVEAARAREIYAAEQQAGQAAATAERHAYFHYQVRVTRVPAGGEVTARVVYYQALEIDSGVGRYLYPMDEGNTDDLDRAFWTMDREAKGRLRLDIELKTAFPIDKLHSPSHPGMHFTSDGEDGWRATLERPGAGLDRDFVLLYRLRPDVPARVELLTHRAAAAPEGTFMAVVTPGADLAPIEGGTDWALVLDVSGSMKGDKLRLLKHGVAKALRGLRPGDRFQLMTFNNTARRLTSGWEPIDATGLATADRLLDGIRADGGTNVFAGLGAAYQVLDADRPTGILLVSDGVANVGPHHYRELLGLAKKHDVRIFTFVIGNSANERMMADLATTSGGTSASISVRDEIGAQLLLARDRMTHTALHGLQFELAGAATVHPRTLPNLYLGQQLVVVGRYAKTGPSKLIVRARISGQAVAWELDVDLPDEDLSNPELERLYALQAIADLERESLLRTGDAGEARAAIVDMALRYALVTDYTSMIVVRDERKTLYGLGDDNATRRAAEQKAAAARSRRGNTARRHTGGTPLAGTRPAHAPTRWSQTRKSGGSGGGGSGGSGGGGSGALGPLHTLLVAGMAVVAMRRRRRGRA